MEDLITLRKTCKDMRATCKDGHVGRCIPLQRALSCEVFKPYYNRRYINRLIHKLARAGHTDAYFCKGMRIIFGQNGGALWLPLDNLERAANNGHTTVAYTLTLFLYRRNSGTTADETMMRLLKMVEGDEEPGAQLPAADKEQRRFRETENVCGPLGHRGHGENSGAVGGRR
ncbi:unnamed protein product [Urochloa humidicola]